MEPYQVTLTDFKQNLGDIINRAAYGGERIVLLARGKPRAALISIEDLERLLSWEQNDNTSRNLQEQLDLLAEMSLLRSQMVERTNSAETLHEVREERSSDLMGMS